MLLSAVVGRAVLDEAGEHDTLVHLQWRPPDTPVAIQVYVNGDLADVVADSSSHEAWLILDRASVQEVELLALPLHNAVDVWAGPPTSNGGFETTATSRIQVALLRDETLPIDTKIGVLIDGNRVGEALFWNESDPRSGFGGLFGVGGFGRDAASGPGLGRGELGYGPLGIDGTAWRWRSLPLESGEHALELEASDAMGVSVGSASDLGSFATAPTPSPASHLSIDADFTLNWNA
ncbi:MAG: hypothetical protein AAFX76_02105 [Planctomycetota bacterium]